MMSIECTLKDLQNRLERNEFLLSRILYLLTKETINSPINDVRGADSILVYPDALSCGQRHDPVEENVIKDRTGSCSNDKFHREVLERLTILESKLDFLNLAYPRKHEQLELHNHSLKSDVVPLNTNSKPVLRMNSNKTASLCDCLDSTESAIVATDDSVPGSSERHSVVSGSTVLDNGVKKGLLMKDKHVNNSVSDTDECMHPPPSRSEQFQRAGAYDNAENERSAPLQFIVSQPPDDIVVGGEFEWVIRKRSPECTSLLYYSSVFYTSKGGYRMQIKAEIDRLHGDAYFAIRVMRGLYDVGLPWPFRGQIKIKLSPKTTKFDAGSQHEFSFPQSGQWQHDVTKPLSKHEKIWSESYGPFSVSQYLHRNKIVLLCSVIENAGF